MSSEITFHPDKEEPKETNIFDRPPNGLMIGVIFGEVIDFDLKYVNNGTLACLEVRLSTTLPYKGFKKGYKFYNNRVTVWKDDAERLAKVIEKRDEESKKNGTFLLIYSNRFGGEKLSNGNFSHNFASLRFRIIQDPIEFINEVGMNQDPMTIKLGLLFNVD